MWLIHPRGFYSAVQHWDKPDTLIVRARVRSDLEALRDLLPEMTIASSADADYPFRVEVARADWMRVCATLACEVDWPNFKNEVAARQGHERHDVYLAVWSVLRRLENRGRRAVTEARLW